jgi:hypothetical protein
VRHHPADRRGGGYDWVADHCKATAREGDIYRYSADGVLQGQVSAGPWARLFIPDYAALAARFDPETTYAYMDRGCLVVAPNANLDAPLALFEYDGTPLPLNAYLDGRDLSQWEELWGRELPLIYAEQQQLHH